MSKGNMHPIEDDSTLQALLEKSATNIYPITTKLKMWPLRLRIEGKYTCKEKIYIDTPLLDCADVNTVREEDVKPVRGIIQRFVETHLIPTDLYLKGCYGIMVKGSSYKEIDQADVSCYTLLIDKATITPLPFSNIAMLVVEFHRREGVLFQELVGVTLNVKELQCQE